MKRALLVIVALAIVVLLVSLARRNASGDLTGEYSGEPRSVVVLDAEGSASNVIPVYEPKDGARVSRHDLSTIEFRWSAVPGATRYLFVANDEVGEPVWRTVVADTFLVLTDKVEGALLPGGRLKWIVQVPQRSASTDIHRIEIVE